MCTKKESGTELSLVEEFLPAPARLQQSGRLLEVADKGNIVSVIIGHLLSLKAAKASNQPLQFSYFLLIF